MIHRDLALSGVIAIGFDQDEDLAVFLPGPADVYLCARQHWEALVGEMQPRPGHSLDVHQIELNSEGVFVLKAALVRSGANLT